MASVYLVLKLESVNPQYCTGLENACVSWGVVLKIGISALMTANEGVSQRLKNKKKTKNRAFRNKAIRK